MSSKSKLLRITPSRLRTNPTWTVNAVFKNASLERNSNFKQLSSRFRKWICERELEGYLFSSCARQHSRLVDYQWQSEVPPEPRVVGLVVDNQAVEDGDKGFANPLQTSRSTRGWRVTKNYLPFHPEQIQDALFQVLQESCPLSLNNVVPEVIGFSIQEGLNEWTSGDSMIIAGLLSVVDAMNGYSCGLFSKACAIVMPRDEELVAVDSIDVKLKAFTREYQAASLLVAPKDFQTPKELERYFPEDVIWRVSSYGELAGKLAEAGQLESFFEEFPLDIAGLNEARNRLGWLRESKGDAAALKFSERLDKAVNLQNRTLLRVSQGIEYDLRELNRHVGRFAKAIFHSESGVRKLEKMGTRISSYEELVVAKTQLAASFFDGHEFGKGIALISPLVKEIESEPSRVTAEVEIELRNTLGRLQVISGHDGWIKHFEYSESLQKDVDPGSIPRTLCYLIRGLLRTNRLDDGAVAIERLSKLEPQGFSRTELFFFKAELARRQNSTTDELDFEIDENTFDRHPLGIYYQATARQPGRSARESARRLKRAAEEFKKDVGDFSERNILELFSLFVLWKRAVLLKENKIAVEQKLQIDEFLCHSDACSMQSYYSRQIVVAEQTGDFEPLFDSVPYF